MNISTAATISQRCLTHTTSTHKDSTTAAESTVSKADNRDSDNTSSSTSTILREIPTRISQPTPTDAAVDLHNDDDERRQHQTFPPLAINLDESRTFLTRTQSCHADISSDSQLLEEITAKMQQRRPLPLESIDQHRTIKDDVQSYARIPPPDPSSHQHPAPTSENEDAPCPQMDCLDTIAFPSFQETQHLLDTMTQNSQALRNLIALSEKLLASMTHIESALDAIIPAPPQGSALVSLPHSMATRELPNITTPATVTDLTTQQFPSNRNNLHWQPNASPWPSPPALIRKSAQKLPPRTRKKLVPAKPSVARGCPGMSRTKDNLRPP